MKQMEEYKIPTVEELLNEVRAHEGYQEETKAAITEIVSRSNVAEADVRKVIETLETMSAEMQVQQFEEMSERAKQASAQFFGGKE